MIRNRIIDHILLRGRDLQDNAGNWRIHPQAQVDAVNAILANIGIVDELLIYKSIRQGGWTVIDGHLRKDEHPDVEWPCTVVDLNDDEADAVLAAFDRLTAKAEADNERLGALIQRVQERDAALLRGVFDKSEIDELVGKELKAQKEILLEQAVQLKPPREYIVVVCDDLAEFDGLRAALDLQQVRRGGYKKGSQFDAVGIQRVVRASDLLQRLDYAYSDTEQGAA